MIPIRVSQIPERCPLCLQPPDNDMVPFGIFKAHAGCAQDWAHEELWEDAQRGVEQ